LKKRATLRHETRTKGSPFKQGKREEGESRCDRKENRFIATSVREKKKERNFKLEDGDLLPQTQWKEYGKPTAWYRHAILHVLRNWGGKGEKKSNCVNEPGIGKE